MFLKFSQYWLENNIPGSACNFIKKEALAQVFSFEFCDVFKKTFLKKKSSGSSFYNYI